MVGSRSEEKAVAVVKEILAEKADSLILKDRLFPTSNKEIAAKAETIIGTVPFDVAVETVRSLKENFRGNQIFISAAAFLEKQDHEFHAGTGTSIAQQIRSILPETVDVAAAFQTVPAVVLYKNSTIEGDVLVACDKKSTFEHCADLITTIKNLKPLHAGSLNVALQLEGLTSILLNVAIKNHLKNPTFKILDDSTRT